jgi:hypothetical protein
MERQQGGAVEAWTNDALQWRHVVPFPFFFFRSFVCIFHEQILTFKAWQEIYKASTQKFGYTYALKTNERIRQKWTRKNLRIDDDSVDISCVDVTGIFFLLFRWSCEIFPVVNIIICLVMCPQV